MPLYGIIIGLAAAWAAILVGGWLGWQLLRQNGRLLLRLEALEERLNELEFGEEDDPADRFSNRSLAKSKIKRDGLKAGTPAPDFRLPRLDGRGELSLSDFRGRRMLLVFSSPQCGPCSALAPELEKFHRASPRPGETVHSLSSNGGEGRGEEAVITLRLLPSRGLALFRRSSLGPSPDFPRSPSPHPMGRGSG
jgi:hypothetical protein